VTFSAAIAATFVSTAVQTKDADSCWDEVAVGLMLADARPHVLGRIPPCSTS